MASASPLFVLRDATNDQSIQNPYGYTPTFWICVMFVVLFSIPTLMQFIYSLYTRRWFLLPTVVLAGIGEIIGWSARLWSNRNVLDGTPFTMQIAVLIISPTPLLGAHFIIFGRLVGILGPQFSRLSPVLYSRIFLSCDIACLVVQALGGGIASSANTDSGTKLGTDIMLAGIVMQIVVIVVFSIIALEFLHRFHANKPVRWSSANNTVIMDRRRKIGIMAVFFATFILFVRAIFRTVELSDGWRGKVIQTQWLFDVFDAAMVILALYTWCFIRPGWIFADQRGFNPVELSSQTTLPEHGSANPVKSV